MKHHTGHTYQGNIIAIILFLLLTSTHTLNAAEKNKDMDWYDLIMKRIQEDHKSVDIENVDKYTSQYITQLNNDGSFSDIDYDDRSQTAWKPLAHLKRMKYMILSYTSPSSKYYKNKKLYDQIVKMFNYWYDKHPLSTNWYNQQIASPQRIGVMLILMRSGHKQLPKELETKLLERMESEGGRPDQEGSPGIGANKLDIATHWVYRGCLLKNEDVLSFGTEQVYYPLFLTTDQGLQHDYSYHQHGNQIHIGAYGYVFINGISSIAEYMVGTPYEMSKEKLDYLSSFVRKAYLPAIRGQYFMFSVVGRSISRKGSLNQRNFVSVLDRMKKIDKDNINEYDQAIARLEGVQPASYGLKPENLNFWRSDYMIHQRPEYTYDVRGSSVYTTRSENGNKENLKGYFLTDGATKLVIDGDEYADIFGVLDWSRIPGTTTPVVDTIPLPDHWEQPGNSTFSGGVSDGLYGIATYLYYDLDFNINTSARKAWFMFDKEIVALGANIRSISPHEINTTVNQTLLKDNVWIKHFEGNDSLLNKGAREYLDLEWIYHNKIGYYFPKKNKVNVSNQIQSGSWSSINTSQSKDIESKEVLKIWFNHGVKPNNESYEYILLPNIEKTQLEEYKPSNIQIIYNQANIQAVYQKDLDILDIVFYTASTYNYDGLEITVDKPCLVMIKNLNSTEKDPEVFMSDPSRTSPEISFSIKDYNAKYEDSVTFLFSTRETPYAGSSQSKKILKNYN